MSTFSGFRAVVAELLLNTRPPGFGSALPTYAPFRQLHTSLSRAAWVKGNQPITPGIPDGQKKEQARKAKELALRPIDNFIPYKKVRVRSPEGISDLRSLKNVVAEVDRLNAANRDGKRVGHSKQYHAVLVANDPEPIVNIVDFKAQFHKNKRVKEGAKKSAVHNVRKEVQLSWNSAEGDVEVKLKKVMGDLEKGYKVDVAFTSVGRFKSWPRRDEQDERLQQIATRFQAIAKEWRPRDITGPSAVIYLQSTAQNSAEEADKKKAEKWALKEQRREAQMEKLRRKQELEKRTSSDNPDAYEIPLL